MLKRTKKLHPAAGQRLCVYNVGLKVDAAWETSTVVMMSYYENVRLCKRHTVVPWLQFHVTNSTSAIVNYLRTTVMEEIRIDSDLNSCSQKCGMQHGYYLSSSYFRRLSYHHTLKTAQSILHWLQQKIIWIHTIYISTKQL